jgi:hypothetical protein
MASQTSRHKTSENPMDKYTKEIVQEINKMALNLGLPIFELERPDCSPLTADDRFRAREYFGSSVATVLSEVDTGAGLLTYQQHHLWRRGAMRVSAAPWTEVGRSCRDAITAFEDANQQYRSHEHQAQMLKVLYAFGNVNRLYRLIDALIAKTHDEHRLREALVSAESLYHAGNFWLRSTPCKDH